MALVDMKGEAMSEDMSTERALIDIIQRILIVPNLQQIEDTIRGIYMDFGKEAALALMDDATERLKEELGYELKRITSEVIDMYEKGVETC
jgi:hypothetical protein